MQLSDIGTRGLVVHTKNEEYKYVTEETWRSRGARSNRNVQDLKRLQAVIAPIAPTTVFVNFDLLKGLSPGVSSNGGGAPAPNSEWTILVNEDANLVEVSSTLFETLDAGSLGDAAVLVRRGAVVAAIPQNSIPSGSFCVLINLAGIKGA
jgi:hypothetical protein